MSKENKLQYVFRELGQHFPYSIMGVTFGIIVMGILSFFAILMEKQHLLPVASGDLFHVFHPAHLLISAIATTSMFWKHEKKLLKAILVGFVGTVTICGISDILFPFLGGKMLGVSMKWHLCLIEEPFMVFAFSAVGVFSGIFVTSSFEKATQYSHSAHVFISSSASILYLLAFGMTDWIHSIGTVFLLTLIAVVIPCCLSDIVFPLTCAHYDCDHSEEEIGHGH